MKFVPIIILEILMALPIVTLSQSSRKVISSKTYSINTKILLETVDNSQSKGVQLSNDGKFGITYGPSHILVFDVDENKAITQLEQPNLVGAGFIDESTIGFVTSSGRRDSLFIFNFVLERLVNTSQLPSPQNVEVKWYSVFNNAGAYYIGVNNESTVWTLARNTHQIIREEHNTIYGNSSGDILKHFYNGTCDVSYATQRLQDEKIVKHETLSPKVAPTSQSFSKSGDRILVVDAFSSMSSLNIPDLYIFDTSSNKAIYSARTGRLTTYCSFISDVLFITIEIDKTSRFTYIVLRSIDGKTLIEEELSQSSISSIQLAQDKNSLIYQVSGEGDIYVVRFSEPN